MDNRIFSVVHLPQKSKVLYCSSPLWAYIFYRDFKLNLLTGEKVSTSPKEIHKILSEYKLDYAYESPVIIHLFYEFGFSCLELFEKLPAHKPLAIFVKYKDSSLIDKDQALEFEEDFELEITEYPSFENYHKKFEQVYKNLIDGNCYQVNLTGPFYFKFKGIDNPLAFIRYVWNKTLAVGAYAHGTYIDSLGKLYLSNSPECLFEIKKEKKSYVLYTMPIKGTIKAKNEAEKKEKWQQLISSEKDQAELFMITDLLKNDLTRISMNPAVVINKKLPLFVPGLVHQYSKIKVELDGSTNLDQIIKATFPGGSITGAPKKRVMEIIHHVEAYERGFYCGSTIVLHKDIKSASINIRSAVLDYTQNELFYGAGGAITLLSQPKSEFDESYAKMESFLQFLKVKNVNKS